MFKNKLPTSHEQIRADICACFQNKCAGEVATVLLEMFYPYGPPRRVITNQGREFVNEVCMYTLSVMCHICHVRVLLPTIVEL